MHEPTARWSWPLLAGPHLLLAVLAGMSVLVREDPGSSPVPDLVLCAVLAAWLLGMFTLRPGWRGRTRVMAVFCAGLVLLIGALAARNPWFGLYTPVGYVYVFRLLRWPWQLAGVSGVAVAAGTAQAHGVDKSTWSGLLICLAVLAGNALPMCVFAWFLRRHDEQERERERVLAENAALHEQLLVQARASGVREERQRMAREIHDTLAQGLTGIITQLQAAQHTGDDPVQARRHLDAATALARESLTEARRSVHALRPEPLRTARLGEALAEVATRWSALHRIPVQVGTTGTARPLPPEAEVALLRIAQEALANVAKHARARRVGVTLSYLEREVALDVRDDGGGFDLATPRAGFGLVAMRQRVAELSGTLAVESEPGAGTGISARVPVHCGGSGG